MAVNIPYTVVNVRKLMVTGQQARDAEHAAKNAPLAGFLRAGSPGCIVDGSTFGECHRIAHLRARGVDKTVEPNRALMFAAGEANEDLWENVLVPAWPGDVLRKQRVQRQGSWGTVSGEPDIVLAIENAWVVGLELKLVSSNNSAVKRELEGEPDSKHLIQSAVYMWLTGLPYVLCYTSRADFSIEFQRKKYGVPKLQPFYRLFYLTIKDDRLYYRDEYSQDEIPTAVIVPGIIDYYQRVHDMAFNYDLGARPQNHHVNGTPAAWDKCSPKYCPFAEACNNYERDYNTWFDAATSIAREGTHS